MNEKETQNPLVFTLFEDEVGLPEAVQTANDASDEIEDWEQALARVRERRAAPLVADMIPSEKENTPIVPAVEAVKPVPVATKVADNNAIETVEMEHILSSARRRKLDVETQKQVQQAYIQHWQQQQQVQNPVAENAPADVVFVDDWHKQQGKGGVGRQDVLAERATVWVNRNRQARLLEGQSILAKLVAREQQETHADAAADAVQQSAENEAQRLPEAPKAPIDWDAVAEKIVLLNVYQPNARTQNPLICLSEEALLQRLAEKLRPHLSDAVTGMVKTIIQRKQAAMLQELQQDLMEAVPQLVDDVLNHNLARAIGVIKKEQQRIERGHQ